VLSIHGLGFTDGKLDLHGRVARPRLLLWTFRYRINVGILLVVSPRRIQDAGWADAVHPPPPVEISRAMHSLSINLGKQLKGHSNYLRWFLEEHPAERRCLLRMYPIHRRWILQLLLETRWIPLVETEINLAAALTGITPQERTTALQSICEVYRRRPLHRGPKGWIQRLLEARPLRLRA